ncbi:MAG: T9SS type A sorting domain-containing protein [Bacteroidales bacterium]|nr:T9SS type A sorting domain-containing protein [Bacteroidales bacterium]
MKRLIIILAIVSACGLNSLAQTNEWQGTTSINWHQSSNWSLNRVPLATDDVVIPGAPANKPVISTSNAACWSLSIQSGATLTLQSSRTLTLSGNWFNQAGASGFVANTGTVKFTGTTNQQINNSSGTETFYHLVVDKPAGVVMTLCSFVFMGDFTLLGGNFEAQTIGKTYAFYGNVAFNGSGIFWPQGTCYFRGATNTSFHNNGYSSYFIDFVLEKTNASNKLTMFADLVCGGGELAKVEKGILDLGGFRFQSSAPMQINNGGKMLLPPGSNLNIRNSLQINNGGEMEVAGHPNNPPLIYRDVNYYSFEVNSGGIIKAEHAIFHSMNADGIHIKAGASVDPDKAFNFCTFGNGVSGGVLLTINNNQTFTVTEANFEGNYWGGAFNVRKSVNSGNVTFYAFSGAFAGENYDDDPYNRITWETGVSTNFLVFNQSVFNGIEKCYNATQTLTAQYLYVYNGGQATLIAGQKIILLPDTRVFQGGYLNARITTDENYCNNLQSNVLAEAEPETVEERLNSLSEKDLELNIFPNPTAGLITMKFMGNPAEVMLEIYNIHAECLTRQELSSAGNYQYDLSGYLPGIYLLRMIAGNKLITKKIVKH